jgi:hypothetical protein
MMDWSFLIPLTVCHFGPSIFTMSQKCDDLDPFVVFTRLLWFSFVVNVGAFIWELPGEVRDDSHEDERTRFSPPQLPPIAIDRYLCMWAKEQQN